MNFISFTSADVNMWHVLQFSNLRIDFETKDYTVEARALLLYDFLCVKNLSNSRRMPSSFKFTIWKLSIYYKCIDMVYRISHSGVHAPKVEVLWCMKNKQKNFCPL